MKPLNAKKPSISLLHLYDRYLNIYADRGNITILKTRAHWRGIDLTVRGLELGESFEPSEHDLIYIGGGQDRDQALIAEHMNRDIGAAIRSAVEEGAALLAVCGGYQLLGNYYRDTSGTDQQGVGLFDVVTHAETDRLVGNIAIETTLPAIGNRPAHNTVIVGFENHAGRTKLRANAKAFGSVTYGYGNDGVSKEEGCRLQHAIGTYLHGPLLPRNPQLSDWLLAAALAHAHGGDAAGIVDSKDTVPIPVQKLENLAHNVSVQRAKKDHT